MPTAYNVNRNSTPKPPMPVIISQYTRDEAIADGELVDFSKTAREAGVMFPCAMTARLFNELKPNQRDDRLGQSVDGRIWDLLTMFKIQLKNQTKETDGKIVVGTRYVVEFIVAYGMRRRVLAAHAVLSHEFFKGVTCPAWTFMLPGED